MPPLSKEEELHIKVAELVVAIELQSEFIHKLIQAHKLDADATRKLAIAIQKEVRGYENYPGLKGDVVTLKTEIRTLKSTNEKHFRIILSLTALIIGTSITLITSGMTG